MSPWTSFQLLFLILGCIVRYTHQLRPDEDVTPANCSSPTQYYNEDAKKCCDRCPPGEYAKEECHSDKQTRCEVCRTGSYTAGWNHMKKCLRCQPCAIDFILKVNCSTSRATVCECQEGYVCEYIVNHKCQSCHLSPITSAPKPEIPTDIPPTEAVEVKDPASIVSDPYIWITILILGIFLVLLTVFICIKSSIGKKIAHEFRMSGARSPINRGAEHGGSQTTCFQRSPLLPTPTNRAAVGPPYNKVSPSMRIQQPESQTHQYRDVDQHICIPQEATTHPYQEGGTDKCCTAIGDNDFKIDIIMGNICYCHQNAMVLQQAKRHGAHTPVKEEGADLPYPIEESQQSKCSSMALNPPGSICTFTPSESSSRSSSSSEALS